MFAKLTGIIDDIDEDSAILDVGGVGYQVFASSRTLATLAPGQAAKLFIETNVREDHIHLYGFADAAEREWFRTLATVQRVGNKMALAILGAYPPAQLAQVILAKDTASLGKISGVGPKLAERMITELKDKVAKLPVDGVGWKASGNAFQSPSTPNPPPSTHAEDAISALVNLGYNRTQAYSAVLNAQARQGDASLDKLITLGLEELTRK